MRLAELAGKRVVVWGRGLEGVAAAKCALRCGADVAIAVDVAERGPADLDVAGTTVPIRYGREAVAALHAAEVVVKSPSIPPYNEIVRALTAEKVPMHTGPALWLKHNAARTIAVTGTKGKSTTANLLAHLMTGLGYDVALGGNIGVPLLDLAEGHDWYVAEISSYQARDVGTSPRGVVVTSLYPEHLDWHGDAETYFSDKLNLVTHGADFVVANADSALLVRELPRRYPTDRIDWVPSLDIQIVDGVVVYRRAGERIELSKFPLIGAPSRTSLALGLRVLERLGTDLLARASALTESVAAVSGLHHRLEIVSNAQGLLWVDDAIATVAESTVVALTTFDNHDSITLIVGGADRGISYDALRDYLERRKAPVLVIAMPENGAKILTAIGSPRNHAVHDFVEVPSLTAAVIEAARRTPAGGVVLLSPAAPRGGRFPNADERGAAFRSAIAELGAPSSP